MTLLALALNDAIFVQNDQVRTTSLKVAEAFGRQHKNVIQKVENLECSAEFASANFSAHVQKVSIGNGANRESKYYEMTKDGFMFLVMGFTGKVAAQIKEAYINAFNAMAAQLSQQHTTESFGGQVTRVLTADERATLNGVIGSKAKEHQLNSGGDWGKLFLRIEKEVCRMYGIPSLNAVRYHNLAEIINLVGKVELSGGKSKSIPSSTDDRTGLRDAVNLLVSKKHLMYPEAYSLIHHRFGVEHLDQLNKEQLPSAIEYVHKLALEGELLLKAVQPADFALTRQQAQNLNILLHHAAWVEFRWQQGIGKGVAAINADLYAKTFEHVQIMSHMGKVLDQELVEIKQAFKHLGGLLPYECSKQGISPY